MRCRHHSAPPALRYFSCATMPKRRSCTSPQVRGRVPGGRPQRWFFNESISSWRRLGAAVHRVFNETISSWQGIASNVRVRVFSLLVSAVYRSFRSHVALQTRDSVTSAATAVFAAMVALLALLTLAIVVPILYKVDRARDHFIIPFFEIPPSLSRLLLER